MNYFCYGKAVAFTQQDGYSI